MFAIYRIEPDGTETLVAYVDDEQEIGVTIYADRDNVDYEPGYHVVNSH